MNTKYVIAGRFSKPAFSARFPLLWNWSGRARSLLPRPWQWGVVFLCLIMLLVIEDAQADKGKNVGATIPGMRVVRFLNQKHQSEQDAMNKDENCVKAKVKLAAALKAEQSDRAGKNTRESQAVKDARKAVETAEKGFKRKFSDNQHQQIALPLTADVRVVKTGTGEVHKQRASLKHMVQSIKSEQECNAALTSFKPVVLGVKILPGSPGNQGGVTPIYENVMVFGGYLHHEKKVISLETSKKDELRFVTARHKEPSAALQRLSTSDVPMSLVRRNKQADETVELYPDLIIVRPVSGLKRGQAMQDGQHLYVMDTFVVKPEGNKLYIETHRFSFPMKDKLNTDENGRVHILSFGVPAELVLLPAVMEKDGLYLPSLKVAINESKRATTSEEQITIARLPAAMKDNLWDSHLTFSRPNPESLSKLWNSAMTLATSDEVEEVENYDDPDRARAVVSKVLEQAKLVNKALKASGHGHGHGSGEEADDETSYAVVETPFTVLGINREPGITHIGSNYSARKAEEIRKATSAKNAPAKMPPKRMDPPTPTTPPTPPTTPTTTPPPPPPPPPPPFPPAGVDITSLTDAASRLAVSDDYLPVPGDELLGYVSPNIPTEDDLFHYLEHQFQPPLSAWGGRIKDDADKITDLARIVQGLSKFCGVDKALFFHLMRLQKWDDRDDSEDRHAAQFELDEPNAYNYYTDIWKTITDYPEGKDAITLVDTLAKYLRYYNADDAFLTLPLQ